MIIVVDEEGIEFSTSTTNTRVTLNDKERDRLIEQLIGMRALKTQKDIWWVQLDDDGNILGQAVSDRPHVALCRASEPRGFFIDVVLDGPPGHEAGRFVEVEDPEGCSIGAGSWVKRDDGFYALRIYYGKPTSPSALIQAYWQQIKEAMDSQGQISATDADAMARALEDVMK